MIKKRVNAHLFVTNSCNLQCKHCYSYKNATKKVELSLNEMVTTIKILCDSFDTYIDAEGGELFLHKDIVEWIGKLSKDEREHITITTNGTIFPEIEPEYLKQLDEFRVSIEGHTDELHSVIRGIPLKTVINNCKKWVSQGIPIVARMTLNKMNYKYVRDYIESLIKLGIRRFSFYEFQAVGRGEQSKEKFILADEDFDEIFQCLIESALIYKNMSYIKLSLTDARISVIDRWKEKLNKIGFEIEDISQIPSITINCDGSIGICPWIPVGYQNMNIKDGELADNIDKILQMQSKRHKCDFCTGVRIKYQPSRMRER